MRPKASRSCPGVGSLSALYPGWAAVADWPRIGKISIEKRSLSCTSPPSASCSEGSAINHEVSGPTLRKSAAPEAKMTTKNAIGENNDAHGVRHNDAPGQGLLGEKREKISVTLAGAAAFIMPRGTTRPGRGIVEA